MKKILLFIAAAILLSCTGNKEHKFTINGTVPSNQYDGEKVYLVPAVGDNPSNVDSTIIKNGKFTLQGDTERVSIIRVKPLLRLDMQDLLVVTEEGHIVVKLDKNSSCHGTKQNEQLQEWKDAVMQNNHDFALLMKAKADSAEVKEIEMAKTRANLSSQKEKSIVLKIIRSDHHSTLSRFLSNMTGLK